MLQSLQLDSAIFEHVSTCKTRSSKCASPVFLRPEAFCSVEHIRVALVSQPGNSFNTPSEGILTRLQYQMTEICCRVSEVSWNERSTSQQQLYSTHPKQKYHKI